MSGHCLRWNLGMVLTSINYREQLLRLMHKQVVIGSYNKVMLRVSFYYRVGLVQDRALTILHNGTETTISID